MEEEAPFDKLCVELVIKIFSNLKIKDLSRLSQCCKRFNEIVKKYRIFKGEKDCLVTHQKTAAIRDRSFTFLNYIDQWRVYHNWKVGRFRGTKHLAQKCKCLPWLRLQKDYLWISQGKYLKAFQRTKTDPIDEEMPCYILNNGSNDDIVRFRIKENFAICGLRGGGIWLWSFDKNLLILNHTHNSVNIDVTDVDCNNHMYVSTSADQSYALWRINFNNEPILLHRKSIHDKIWSVSFSPCNQYVALGTAGFHSIPPFHVYDCQCHKQLINFYPSTKHGGGVLDLYWQNNNTIITCGYDSWVRKWDLRTGNCVQFWEDPFDAVIYCVASDDLYSLVSGTNFYGRVVLWDQRRTNQFVQMYFTGNDSFFKSSPVYSIDFDCCQLFTALDSYVACTDFSIQLGKAQDHRDPKIMLIEDDFYF